MIPKAERNIYGKKKMGCILKIKEVCKKDKIKLKEDPSSLWNNGCNQAFLKHSTTQTLLHYTLGNIQNESRLRQGTERQSFCEKIDFSSALLISVCLSFYIQCYRNYILISSRAWRVPCGTHSNISSWKWTLLPGCATTLTHKGTGGLTKEVSPKIHVTLSLNSFLTV